MPFTSAPDYDAEQVRFADLEGQYGVLEPTEVIPSVETRFGFRPAVDCIFWRLEGDVLIPVSGIRIFSKKLIESLTVALRTKSAIAGEVYKDGQSTRIRNAPPKVMEYMGELYGKIR